MKKLFLLLYCMTMIHAELVPQNVLGKNCLKSYNTSYLSQKNHKAFVYARERETDKDRCNWSSGYTTTEEAIESAMKGCQSYLLNAECIVVATDGIFKVEDDAFSRLTPLDDTPLLVEDKQRLTNEAKTVILGNCLPFFTQKYLKALGHKAFGYSVDANGHYACGYSYKNQTERISKKQAIKSCNDNKVKRGTKAPNSPCKVYAQNKKILLKASDFGIEDKKEAKKLTSTEYDALLSQAKKTIRSWPCQIQFKYFLKSKVHHAFYLTAFKNGKQTCGRSEDAFNLNIAKTQAKNKCESSVKQEKLYSACKLFAQDFEIVAPKDTFVRSKPLKEEQVSKAPRKSDEFHKPMSLKETLQLTANTLNKNLPKMLDSELRLDVVDAEARKMRFMYTLVHFTPKEMTGSRLQSLMYEDTKLQVCNDSDSKMLLKKGMLVDYVYRGKDKNPIITFAFDAKVCGYLTNVEQIKSNILNMIKKKEKEK